MPKLSQKQFLIFGGAAVLVIGLIVLIFSNLKSNSAPPHVSLAVWGTASQEAMQLPIASYHKAHSNVDVVYTKLDPAGYGAQIVDALASGQGPDVFMIGNHDLVSYANKIVPAPAAALTAAQVDTLFPGVVTQDFTHGGLVYALPFSIDTLALFYDKNSFNQAALTATPATWTDFENYVPHLKSLASNGQIVKAAAAIGGSERSVDHATDILEALILQNGNAFVDPSSHSAVFANEVGSQAFDFYLQFANTASPSYTWADTQPQSLEAFASGKVAIAFGYKSDWDALQDKNPYANDGLAPLPQVTPANAVSVARYSGFAVSKQSPSQQAAWDLVIALTTDPATEMSYLEKTHEPPALKSVIGRVINDPDYGVFARQALTARSWYDPDGKTTHDVLNTAIAKALGGSLGSRQALTEAQEKINNLNR